MNAASSDYMLEFVFVLEFLVDINLEMRIPTFSNAICIFGQYLWPENMNLYCYSDENGIDFEHLCTKRLELAEINESKANIQAGFCANETNTKLTDDVNKRPIMINEPSLKVGSFKHYYDLKTSNNSFLMNFCLSRFLKVIFCHGCFSFVTLTLVRCRRFIFLNDAFKVLNSFGCSASHCTSFD